MPARRLGRRLLGSELLEALAAPHGVDRYLELIRPSWSLREARAEVIGVRRQTVDSVTLTLQPNENWRGFSTGQFVRLTIEIDGVRQTRCYSPACSEHWQGRIEVTVKEHPEGLVSGFLNRAAQPGMVVGLSAADGDFVLSADRPERLLLISGGSGITPVISMLRTLCDEGHSRAVTFVHYAPTRDDVIYRRELSEIASCHPNVRVACAYTRENMRKAGGVLTGHLCREHLRAVAPDTASAQAYVCGPPGLIESARRIWAEDGIEQLLHVESFLPPSLAIASDRAEGSVGFAQAGERVLNSGQSLLEQAEQAGLSPQFGCRMGICHTCTCRKTAGSVRNLVTGEVSSAEEEDIQICVSVPVGDVELDL
jgi:ferredoxin-NADP reductase